mmetsp:Transcript_14635/g.33636  ORF Transcript_14635/g.33636 Transcript_14635/m.33636 type:complete len:262 (-) Transcript_14635:1901-2686(-)
MQEGKISPGELHSFIANEQKFRSKSSSKWTLFILRTISSVKSLFTNVLWLSLLSFSLSSFRILIYAFEKEPGREFTLTLGFLGLFGAFSFSIIAYEFVVEKVKREDSVRSVLRWCVKYASLYERKDDLWINYNKKEGLDKKSLSKLMEKSGIILSPVDVNDLFEKIDKDSSGLLCKQELDAYFEEQEDIEIRIIWACLHDLNFLTTSFWLLGSGFYLFPKYDFLDFGDHDRDDGFDLDYVCRVVSIVPSNSSIVFSETIVA